jgi:Ca2+-binding EF-hand superfamily protein
VIEEVFTVKNLEKNPELTTFTYQTNTFPSRNKLNPD